MDSDRRRARTGTEAGEWLGVSQQMVSRYEKHEWWRDDFRTDEGWDVVGIAEARQLAEINRLSGALSTTTTTAADEAIQDANVISAVEGSRIKVLDRRAKERRDFAEDGALVGADVVVACMNECLGGLRVQLDDLCFRFGQQVPAEFRPLVYVAGSVLEDGELEPAPLQGLVEDVVQGYGQQLLLMHSEVFSEDEG